MNPDDFDDIPGYRGNWGPPADHLPTDTRMWTRNLCDTAFFGGQLNEEGMTGVRSTHPMRAMELIGQEVDIPPLVIESEWSDWSSYGPCYDSNHKLFNVYDAPTPEEVPDDSIVIVFIEMRSGALSGERYYIRCLMGWGAVQQRVGTFFYDSVSRPCAPHDVYCQDPQYLNEDHIEVAGDLYKSLYRTDVGACHILLFAVSPCCTYSQCESARIKVAVTLDEGGVGLTYANQELCFYHRGWGWRLDGNGMARPQTMIQPIAQEPALLSEGYGWVCKNDIQPGVGEPGMCIAALPVETPPTRPVTLDGYVRTCGSPT